VIRFTNVKFRYPGSETNAIDGVSFTLEKGSFHYVCGPSGAGKTTIFRMLYMDLLPTEGNLRVFGKDVSTLSRDEIAFTRRRMGIVFQDFRLLDHLTVRENVALPLCLYSQPTKEQDQCVDEILDWVGLGHRLDAHPDQLSGGEKQRVDIARAVVNRPKLLIADEPTGNVDEAMGQRIMHLFCQLNKLGTTVLIATHDKTITKAFPYPVIELDNGKLLKRKLVNVA